MRREQPVERSHVPAAEEEADHDAARNDDLEELAQEEHAEAHARVLDEVADDLGLALGDVEGGPLRLGDRRREEENEPERLRADAPGVREALGEGEHARLLADDRAGLERAEHEERAEPAMPIVTS